MSGRYENWHQPWCVIHGDDALASLPAELDRLGLRRVLLLTTRSLVREGDLLGRVRALVGGRLVAEFGECDAHVPRETVLKVADVAVAAAADAIVCLGGGSVIDTAKATALAAAGDVRLPDDFDRYRLRFVPGSTVEPMALPHAAPAVIALPTTLSAAEFTNNVGMLDTVRGIKDRYVYDELCPKVVFLDEELSTSTPARLWGATGMKVLSDALEQLYSRGGDPAAQAMALEGVRLLSDNLTAAVERAPRARAACYLGSWFALFAVCSVEMRPGIGGAVRHQMGAISRAGHGEIAAVLLPHILRFNLPVVPAVVARLAPVMGVEGGADPVDAIAGRVEALIAAQELPSTLRELGIDRADLPAIAEASLAESSTAGNPREIRGAHEVVQLLEAAY